MVTERKAQANNNFANVEKKLDLISDSILEKSLKHRVVHVHSGNLHIFDVSSPSGNTYSVSVKGRCDCKYQSVQGEPNGKICSHIAAALRKILSGGGLDVARTT
ncbi:MAG TPA: hypothetical protein ENH82_19720 [bacterium]|nr:hypothetical protein [bacterium]